MRPPPSHTGSIVRRLAALALALWLGGAGCFLGCEMDGTAATFGESSSPTAAPSCPAFAGSGGDCCHKAADTTGGTGIDVPSPSGGTMSCCPLAGQSAVVSGNARSADSPGVALADKKAFSFPPSEAYELRDAGRLRVPDRGSTYLRCCVFLI